METRAYKEHYVQFHNLSSFSFLVGQACKLMWQCGVSAGIGSRSWPVHSLWQWTNHTGSVSKSSRRWNYWTGLASKNQTPYATCTTLIFTCHHAEGSYIWCARSIWQQTSLHWKNCPPQTYEWWETNCFLF